MRPKSTRLSDRRSQGTAVVDWVNALMAGTVSKLFEERALGWTPNELSTLDPFGWRSN